MAVAVGAGGGDGDAVGLGSGPGVAVEVGLVGEGDAATSEDSGDWTKGESSDGAAHAPSNTTTAATATPMAN